MILINVYLYRIILLMALTESKIKDFPPSGTRDFLPEDMTLENWLFNIWRKISLEFGCLSMMHLLVWTCRIYGPRKVEGPDILNEMYVFEKDGIQLTLRPEMTPSLARNDVKLFTDCSISCKVI